MQSRCQHPHAENSGVTATACKALQDLAPSLTPGSLNSHHSSLRHRPQLTGVHLGVARAVPSACAGRGGLPSHPPSSVSRSLRALLKSGTRRSRHVPFSHAPSARHAFPICRSCHYLTGRTLFLPPGKQGPAQLHPQHRDQYPAHGWPASERASGQVQTKD